MVAVRLFGPIELNLGGRRLGARDFGGVKPKQVLEVLLVRGGRAVSKDEIAELLWGGSLPRNVARTLETHVSVLRSRLGSARGLLVTEPGGYRFDSDGVRVDLDEFDELLRLAAGAQTVERRERLEAALALARGDVLGDEPYAEWALAPREHYLARQIQALVDLAECCLELGENRAALAAVDRVLARESISERAYRAAMLAHYALGDRDEALRAHGRCRAALSRDLGVAPVAQTAELHMAMLREEDPAKLLGAGNGRSAAAFGRLRAALPVSYAENGGVRIAYQVVGEGPVDLVFVPSFVTNLGASWDDPTYARFLRRLASIARLILFDKRGTGLSDPALDFPSTRERSEDLASVLDAAGSQRAVLFGVCAGGALCAQFAADHPKRTAGLILHAAFARLLAAEDYPWGWSDELYQRLLVGFEEAWLSGEGLERRNPGLADNPRYRDWFARYARLAASPWMARRLAELNAEIDVRPLLAEIKAPCLVICRTEDAWLAPENSHYLAEHIAGASLLELPGSDHDPWVGDTEPVHRALEEFIAGLSPPGAPKGFSKVTAA